MQIHCKPTHFSNLLAHRIAQREYIEEYEGQETLGTCQKKAQFAYSRQERATMNTGAKYLQEELGGCPRSVLHTAALPGKTAHEILHQQRPFFCLPGDEAQIYKWPFF